MSDWLPKCYSEMYESVLDEQCRDCPYKSGCADAFVSKHYPHDYRCEGVMCWCAARARRENPTKFAEWEQSLRGGTDAKN